MVYGRYLINPSWRTGLLGYVSQFTLTSLPSGATYDTPYCWYVAVSQGSSGSGYSFYCQLITYSSAAPVQATVLKADKSTPWRLTRRRRPRSMRGHIGVGVFKSTNGGANWSAANTGLTNTDVRALAIDPATPTTLYAGT